ncbi:MAG TPA: 3-phosphoshikimate 1-carboxyvinyltransferase [Bryobacteraceae bacterium]|jgi:3-phosphoshikimate 1-carboxyvinyltransferase|nr:3-phosphoshikimate 1-carboxyvinyltransferase [Bryobacteraceae bacterium]
MQERILPARRLDGSVVLPGDKSISHRYGMLASIAEGTSRIHNYSKGADCQSTLSAMRSLGIDIENDGAVVVIHGKGLDGLKAPDGPLDAGNSGSTIRMLSGILSAQPFVTTIGGDESLSRRPMQRIMRPLAEMGAHIQAREDKFPPLTIRGGALTPIQYTLPVASAQVKSCVLFAGIFAHGVTTVIEGMRTRDHSELALREFGAEVEVRRGAISITGRPHLQARELTVPGDISAAAFLLSAAQIVPESNITIRGVGLNPTRSSLLDFLAAMGADIKVLDMVQSGGEVSGDLQVRKSRIRGGVLEGEMAAALIDEIPVLSVLGAISEDGLKVRDAAELRVKETDRIATIAENFRRMGVAIEVLPDGFNIPGRQKFHAAEVDSFGDHRIGMAFAVAALAAEGETVVENAEAASVSFPGFYDLLRSLAA